MSNAEKLAKDTEFLADAIADYECRNRDCSKCPIVEFSGFCWDREKLKEWLEQEAKE